MYPNVFMVLRIKQCLVSRLFASSDECRRCVADNSEEATGLREFNGT